MSDFVMMGKGMKKRQVLTTERIRDISGIPDSIFPKKEKHLYYFDILYEAHAKLEVLEPESILAQYPYQYRCR